MDTVDCSFGDRNCKPLQTGNRLEEYCGPLSDITTRVSHVVQKIDFKCLMMSLEVVVDGLQFQYISNSNLLPVERCSF